MAKMNYKINRHFGTHIHTHIHMTHSFKYYHMKQHAPSVRNKTKLSPITFTLWFIIYVGDLWL